VMNVLKISITKETINVKNGVTQGSLKILMIIDAKHVIHIVKHAFYFQMNPHSVKSVL